MKSDVIKFFPRNHRLVQIKFVHFSHNTIISSALSIK